MNDALARAKIKELIQKYDAIKSSGKANGYNEEETKNAFIKPLFEVLGWDFSEKEEVSAEEHIISSGRVDYGFYINSRIKFYLEAKPLKADLNNEEYARQAIRYSFNKGVTWAVLTDFESIKVFNAQSPSKYLGDKQYFELKYSDYLQRFDKLWELSKEAFTQDLIDKKAEEAGKKLQRVPITELLYKDLNECRELLTDSLGEWNRGKVSRDDLDEGVQKLLDRLIFIRVAEDRKIEENILVPLINQWRSTTGANRPELYESMIYKFRELDSTYNSDLFSPHFFEKWEDDGVALEKVIKILYGKRGYYEYDFSIMSTDILGSVYENYLGYKLSQSKKGLTLDKSAGKRKEQGIYYTPDFIVDYIVRNALKPVLDKCKSINELKKIKVLDPACGSGSFLIKALEVITEKYREFGRPINEFTKIQIIIENLYGVDLDEQAVEIARLNLLINALQDKGKLPKLDKNIKNGNSLISGTDEELKKYFGKDFRDKKPFNWQEEFPEVFKQGGFDVIIGNPPYVNLANIKNANERDYLKHEFATAKNKSDLYSFFAEKAIRLLKESGFLGLIFSNSWLGTDSFSKFREFLIKNTTVMRLVKLPHDVFSGATVTTVLIFLRKEKVSEDQNIKLFECVDGKFIELAGILSYERIKKSPGFSFSFDKDINFKVPTTELGKIVKFSLGVKTSDDKRFVSDAKKDKDSHRLLRGKDVGKYWYVYAGKWIWYKPDLMIDKVGAGPRKLEYFSGKKILIKDVAQEIIATYDDEGYLTTDTLSLIYQAQNYDLKLILAILNSRIINQWFNVHFPAGLHIKINQLEHIPIPKVNDEQQHQIVNAVNKILQLNKELVEMPENSNKWNSIKEEIEKTDKKIDEEVYKLYGLTKEEIEIIEN